MSLTDDALKSKFSTLNETQDSIVSVANWMIFHRRHAERVVQAWFARLRDVGSPKRLNLVYLANEVVQQSRLRRKTEFPDAFAPIIADAILLAYKGAAADVQQKLRRVVEVWRSRSVFEAPIVDAVESRLDEMDKSKGAGKKTLMGGSLFSSGKGGVPQELEPLVPLQTAVSKAALSSSSVKTTADTEYEKLNDTNVTLPPPPVHAARLSSLMKALANAESSVNESIRARQELIAGLEKILEVNKSELEKEETLQSELSSRKTATENKKREVEDGIVRGMSSSGNDRAATTATGSAHSTENLDTNGDHGDVDDEGRPEYEALTPPPVEALTPPPMPEDGPSQNSIPEHADLSNLLAAMGGGLPPIDSAPATTTLTANTSTLVRPRSSSSGGVNGPGTSSAKKRKVNHEEEIEGLTSGGDAMEDLDDDVAALLRGQTGGQPGI